MSDHGDGSGRKLIKRRLLVVFVVFGLLMTACSGDTADDAVASLEGDAAPVDADTATPAANGAGEVDQEQVMLAFAACMRENGIEIDDPTVDADGNVGFGRLRSAIEGDVTPEEIDSAREACEGELQGVALRSEANPDRTSEQDVFLEFARCMRENGYDMPDPDFANSGPGGGGAGVGPFGKLDRDDPDFKSAMAPCQDILAGTGPEGNGPPGISG